MLFSETSKPTKSSMAKPFLRKETRGKTRQS